MDTSRLGLPYVYKYILNTCIKKTDHIPREVYWTLCNNLHGVLPGGNVVKNPPANAGDTGSIPGSGRSHMLQSN